MGIVEGGLTLHWNILEYAIDVGIRIPYFSFIYIYIYRHRSYALTLLLSCPLNSMNFTDANDATFL